MPQPLEVRGHAPLRVPRPLLTAIPPRSLRAGRSSSLLLSGGGSPAPARTPRALPGRQGTMSTAPDGSAGVAWTTLVRTPPQPDVPFLGASRHPLPPSKSSAAPFSRAPESRSACGRVYPSRHQQPARGLWAVPRSKRPAARDNDIYAPTPSYQGACLAACRIAAIACRAPPAHRVRTLPIAAAPCLGRDRTAADRRTVIAPLAFAAYRGFWLEDWPRAQHAATVGPTAISGTIPAVGPFRRLRAAVVRLRAGATVGGIGRR